jgi:purine-nucleoside phosphorylase
MAQAGSATMNSVAGRAGDLPRAVEEARGFVAGRTSVRPEVAILLGTGLGRFAESMPGADVIPYADIPGFPTPSVESHAGELILGTLGGKPAAVLNGRVHYYEGYSMAEVAFPVRVARALGARTLIATNAAGGMNPLYAPADIVAVVDHVNLMGDNPLVGKNHDELGPRFPDMSEPYDRALISLAKEVALDEGIALREGVLAAVAGPNLETRAEYRFLRWAGADLVSMSLVPETIAAVHGGMRVLAFAVVTDLCLPDALEPIDVPRVFANAAKAEPLLTRLVTRILERMPAATASEG